VKKIVGSVKSLLDAKNALLKEPAVIKQALYHQLRTPIPIRPAKWPQIKPKDFSLHLDRALGDTLWGVRIYWSPMGAGKSFNSSSVVESFRGEGKILARHLPVPSKIQGDHPHDWFNYQLGLNPRTLLSDSLLQNGTPVLVVLDQFELWYNHASALEFVLSLAIDSSNSEKYMVLLNVADATFANQINQLNNNRKISMLNGFSGFDVRSYKWSKDQVAEAIGEHPNKDRLIDLGVKAGTPDFLKRVLAPGAHLPSLEVQAAEIYGEWESAARLLNRSS